MPQRCGRVGWSPTAVVVIALLLVLTPTSCLDDSDDEVTIQELSADLVDPRVIAGASALLHSSTRLGESAKASILDDLESISRDPDSTPAPHAANASVPEAKYSTIPADSRLPDIQTIALKKQVTRKMLLSNGMGVNIVYNPDLESSSMAVSMEVGSWQDPPEALGMAHFIEHMLFMGTEQHPKPGNFDDFLSAHGAQISNAMTGSQSTTYAFATPHEAFTEGVTRFSEFFTNPLFDSTGATKEMHAVNQEFEMHKDEDFYRMYFVEKELSNPAHPCQRFTIGNLNTLANVTHEALIKWYHEHYSANLMHVSVYTAQPIDEIAQLIADKMTPVKNKEFQRQNTGHIPTMNPTLAGHMTHVKPLTELRHVSIKWDMPSQFAHMEDTDPGRIAATILGDEGPDSLTAFLIKNHLALSLSAGLENSGRDNALFSMSLTLTEKGMADLNNVIALCYRAIRKFGSEAIPNFYFEEAVLKDKNRWMFQWRTSDVFDAAMGDAQSMIQEPLETYPARQSVLQAFNASAVTAIFKTLSPAKAHISIFGDTFDWNSTAVQTEKYYKVKYAVTPVSAGAMNLWTSEFSGEDLVGPDFKMPVANDKLPSDLGVSQVDPSAPIFPNLPQPVLVSNDSFGLLYIKTDDVFGDPYISSSFEIITDAAFMAGDALAQAKAQVMTSLWVSCIEESLRTETYEYRTAGLNYALSVGKGTNLGFGMSGMNTKHAVWEELLQKVLTRVTTQLSVHTSSEDFKPIYQAIARSLKNGLKSGPSAQASRHLWSTLSNTRLQLEDQIKALKETTYNDVVEFGSKFLLKIRVKGFFYGQIPGERAVRYWNLMKTNLKGTSSSLSLDANSLPESSQFVSKFRVLPDDQGPFFSAVQGDARGNSTILIIDGGNLDCTDRIAVEMLYKEVRQMFFNSLRTKQQTGYVAQTSVMQAARRTIAMFVVVSSWAGPGDLLGRYEVFIREMLKGLDEGTTLPAKNFATIKASLLGEFSKPIANIAGMAGILKEVVQDFDGDFDAFKKRKKIIQDMTVDRIKLVASKMFASSNKRRLAMLYSPEHMAPGSPPDQYRPFKNDTGVFEKRPPYKCDIDCTTNATSQTQTTPAPAPALKLVSALDMLEEDDADDEKAYDNVDNSDMYFE